MRTPPEGFPLQFGTGIIQVNEQGIITEARYAAKGLAQADENFQFIIANVSNFDIMNCIGGTIELINYHPTIKFPDGSGQTPPPPEPVKPPSTEQRLKLVEDTMMGLIMKGMML
ncbi:hypothetical protein PBC5_029 [Bacillus phage PBC5]|nr:hypothetical protein PBC5_029 [Bacillus phage PBC5]